VDALLKLRCTVGLLAAVASLEEFGLELPLWLTAAAAASTCC
jgi:hypothetical protein